MPESRPCNNCIKSLETAANTVREMIHQFPELLTPIPVMESYEELAGFLVEFAGRLRIATPKGV